MRYRIFLSLLTVLLALPGAAHEKGTAPGAGKKKLALLIGVSHYPTLAERFQLKGPANDVVLMRQTLVKQFGFADGDIVTLSEQQGKDKDEKFYPTRKNIEREYLALAERAGAGDTVFILMAGHGSQQPEDPRSAVPEPDGLDEIFLPRDVDKWNDTVGKVANAIVDDELGQWLAAIQKKKASVWLLVDACHSGTITRGTAKEYSRELKPDEGLGIPKKKLQEARDNARGQAKGGATRGGPLEPTPLGLADAGGLVAIYAAQAHEVTVELDLPEDSKSPMRYGLLTYNVCQALTRARAAGKKLNYRELVHQVHQQYEAMGRTFPTPMVEGKDATREVLGETKWDKGPAITLSKQDDEYRVNAGTLHGLTTGSVLAVFDKDDKKIGHVKVESVNATDAAVRPEAWDKLKRQTRLPDGARCAVVFVDMGDLQLRLSVDPLGANDKAVAADWRDKMLKRLEALEGKDSVVKIVRDASKADWLVRRDEEDVVLVPARGAPTADAKERGRFFGPAAPDDDLMPWLKTRLAKIARVENLRKVVASAASEADDGGLRLQTELWLGVDRRSGGKLVRDFRGTVPLTGGGPPQLYKNDPLIVRLHNPNKYAIDVTLLMIDSAFNIEAQYPSAKSEEVNRLRSGETAYVRILMDDKTRGAEQLAVIAVRARDKQPVNFRGLAGPKEKSRGTPAQARAMSSALGKVLDRALFAEGTTRGGSREELRELAGALVPYRMMKGPRPAADKKSAK